MALGSAITLQASGTVRLRKARPTDSRRCRTPTWLQSMSKVQAPPRGSSSCRTGRNQASTSTRGLSRNRRNCSTWLGAWPTR